MTRIIMCGCNGKMGQVITQIVKEDENTEIFKELIKKPIKELDSEQMKVYNEIGVVSGFTFKEIHRLLILDFRGCMYIVNILNGGVFEYIGKLEEIIEYFIQ